MNSPIDCRSLVVAAVLAAWSGACAAQASPAPPPMPALVQPAAPSKALDAAGSPGIKAMPGGAEAGDAEAPASRWKADIERLDSEIRLRLLSANDPRADWVAGEIDAADVEAKVRHFTAARVNAPGERLYLASLAAACLQPVRPPLAPCEAVDRLADWARRDDSNGVPAIYLADRARRRGEFDLSATFVEQAGAAPRFDDYWSEAAQQWWGYLRPLIIDIDPAAKARAASNYALARAFDWASPLRALCAEPGNRSDRMQAACSKLGQAMAERSATFALRRAGARIAEINAGDAARRTAAQALHARILAAAARCTVAEPDFAAALESPAGRTRGRGIEEFETWANALARDGEVAACERIVAAAPRR